MMENRYEFREILDPADIERVADLAGEIWREHYTGLIGTEQVEYMIGRFQSAPAIARQIAEDGCRYFAIEENREMVAYCAIQPENDRLFLSKFYVRKDRRGLGLGRRMLQDALSRFNVSPETIVWLTVNKGNAGSITAYEKLGFHVADEIVSDIGRGFVMDDYRMETILQRVGTCGPG